MMHEASAKNIFSSPLRVSTYLSLNPGGHSSRNIWLDKPSWAYQSSFLPYFRPQRGLKNEIFRDFGDRPVAPKVLRTALQSYAS
eukprot:6202948-Pleurochrysis_carterae.AAC.1